MDHKKKLNKIFLDACDSYRYQWGIDRFYSFFEKNRKLRVDKNLIIKLATLYDHQAMKVKDKKTRERLETKAMDLCRFVLKRDRTFIPAVWGIGRIWWHRRNNKALFYARKAYRLARAQKKSSGLYAQNIGAVYKMMGDMKRSEYWLLRGIKESPRDWSVYFNLVSFYKDINKKEKAKRYALKLNELLKKENKIFKMKTEWGKTIMELIDSVLINSNKGKNTSTR